MFIALAVRNVGQLYFQYLYTFGEYKYSMWATLWAMRGVFLLLFLRYDVESRTAARWWWQTFAIHTGFATCILLDNTEEK